MVETTCRAAVTGGFSRSRDTSAAGRCVNSSGDVTRCVVSPRQDPVTEGWQSRHHRVTFKSKGVFGGSWNACQLIIPGWFLQVAEAVLSRLTVKAFLSFSILEAMMKIKLFAATVLAAASVSAFAVGPGALGPIDNVPVSIANIVPMGIFQDVYSFTLVNPGDLSGNVAAINSDGSNILGLTVTLQDSSFAVIGSDASPGTGFTFSNLTAGNYAFNVLGFASGSSGGTYAGSMIATTVPEPETYALMLAGLGIVGFVAARRRAQR